MALIFHLILRQLIYTLILPVLTMARYSQHRRFKIKLGRNLNNMHWLD